MYEVLRDNPNIIRNRLKLYATRKNAAVFLELQKEFGTFSNYLWGFVGGKPTINEWVNMQDVPVTDKVSEALSKDLKKRGMSFVGSTIIYAYMQAIGMVNDHCRTCWCYERDRGR